MEVVASQTAIREGPNVAVHESIFVTAETCAPSAASIDGFSSGLDTPVHTSVGEGLRCAGQWASDGKFRLSTLDIQPKLPYTYRAQGITYKILLNAVPIEEF